ncbi:nucleotidyltransferase domain-containing protein [Egicoccus sp. AB-alg6-2]|uniref:type VII toxin-antitoxin system MntA family adenylyltransferase antitoxin n=1 Tax=Egicoccus sp. AB-alg6-2 TaxID=3242692 RepID=UPI00359E47C2
METSELVETIGTALAGEPVEFAYLFGSQARGDAQPHSDVDLAVLFADGLPASDRFERFLELGARLERLLGRHVDVVDLAEAPLRLAGRILTERVVVVGLQSAARVRYETDLLPRFLDFDHHARQLDQALLATMARQAP